MYEQVFQYVIAFIRKNYTRNICDIYLHEFCGKGSQDNRVEYTINNCKQRIYTKGNIVYFTRSETASLKIIGGIF